jgi:hypothetical protein
LLENPPAARELMAHLNDRRSAHSRAKPGLIESAPRQSEEKHLKQKTVRKQSC